MNICIIKSLFNEPFLKYFLAPVSCFNELNFLLSCGHCDIAKQLPIDSPPLWKHHIVFALSNFSVFVSRGWLPGLQHEGVTFYCVFSRGPFHLDTSF